MSGNRISVITINLNNAEGLERTLQSVAAQSLHCELLVIDGGSTDGSAAVISAFSDTITYSVSEKDRGIYEAMNKGIKAATGDYLLFLNSGDTLYSNEVIEKAAALLAGAEVVSGDLVIHGKVGRHHVQSEDVITTSLFWRLNLYHQATFIKATLFQQYGLYNEIFKIAGDMEFFIRCLLRNVSVYKHIPLTICNYYEGGISNDPVHSETNFREREQAWQINFSEPVINDLRALFELKRSPFFWIMRKTVKRGFFFYFFSFWNMIFLGGLKIIEKFKRK